MISIHQKIDDKHEDNDDNDYQNDEYCFDNCEYVDTVVRVFRSIVLTIDNIIKITIIV